MLEQTSLYGRIMRWKRERPSNTSTPSATTDCAQILPFDVRYALEYRGAKLGVEEIRALTNDAFLEVGGYLVAKALRDDPDTHHAFLSRYMAALRVGRQESLDAVEKALGDMSSTTQVEGAKVAQLNRQGLPMWREEYRRVVKDLHDQNRHPALLAHSTFIGLPEFLATQHFDKDGKGFDVLVPEWFEQERVGYSVRPSDEGRVDLRFLQSDFERKKMQSSLMTLQIQVSTLNAQGLFGERICQTHLSVLFQIFTHNVCLRQVFRCVVKAPPQPDLALKRAA